MKAKTLVELLTLSTNLYMISKDEEFMKNLSEMTEKGKKKVSDFIDDFSEEGDGGEEKLVQKILVKAKQAKEELEKKIEEIAVNIYDKMHIAHTDEIKKLAEEIERVKRELALAETKIINLEQRKS
ncbi:MAG: hypothetical protein ACHQHP_01385 [Bacteroidia bacterium]